ncbi:MAG TPA: hypothetical protein ENH35_03000 [Candidatus Moranbacteria bacterium]|nr:hypothetical protein [Candidatus Moranbacteria bacterium]
MAVSGKLLTYLATGNKPDVSNIIDLIAYLETPSLSTWPKETVTNKVYQWYDYGLSSAAADNKVVEGADASTASNLTRTNRTNVTQILEKVIEVSRTQRKIAKYGNIGDELTWQQTAKLQELARDLDKTLMQGTYSAGSSVAARSMRGAEAAITTTTTAASGASLTETMVRVNVLQAIWDAGGRGDKTLYCNSFNKYRIDQFTGVSNIRVNIAPQGGIVTLPFNVGFYASSFGNLRVMLTPHASAAVVSVIPNGNFKTAVFDGFQAEPLGKTGDATKVQVVGEYGLKHRQEAHAGKITGLATS